MYKAKIRVTYKDIIEDEYYFSYDDKGELLLCATSWFLGYIQGLSDGGKALTIEMPGVMSIDGYQAWTKDGKRYRLLNANGDVIKNLDDII